MRPLQLRCTGRRASVCSRLASGRGSHREGRGVHLPPRLPSLVLEQKKDVHRGEQAEHQNLSRCTRSLSTVHATVATGHQKARHSVSRHRTRLATVGGARRTCQSAGSHLSSGTQSPQSFGKLYDRFTRRSFSQTYPASAATTRPSVLNVRPAMSNVRKSFSSAIQTIVSPGRRNIVAFHEC